MICQDSPDTGVTPLYHITDKLMRLEKTACYRRGASLMGFAWVHNWYCRAAMARIVVSQDLL